MFVLRYFYKGCTLKSYSNKLPNWIVLLSLRKVDVLLPNLDPL